MRIFKLSRVSPTLDLSAFIVMLVRRGEAFCKGFCLYVFLCLCGGAMSFSRFGQTLKDVAKKRKFGALADVTTMP